jgi:hypothetical protein
VEVISQTAIFGIRKFDLPMNDACYHAMAAGNPNDFRTAATDAEKVDPSTMERISAYAGLLDL